MLKYLGLIAFEHDGVVVSRDRPCQTDVVIQVAQHAMETVGEMLVAAVKKRSEWRLAAISLSRVLALDAANALK